MRRTVDFDHQPGVETGEVGDVPAEDDLTAKPEVRDLLAPKALPEAALGVGRIALRERATGLNDFGMARPPTLTRPV